MLGFFLLFFAGLGGLIAVLYWLEVSLDRPRETPSALRRLSSAPVARARARLQPQPGYLAVQEVAGIRVQAASGPEDSRAA